MLLQYASVQYGMAKKDAAAAANPQVCGTLLQFLGKLLSSILNDSITMPSVCSKNPTVWWLYPNLFFFACVCVWHLCKNQIMIHVFRVVSPCLMMFRVVSLWSFLAQISSFIHTISTTHISTRSHLFIFDQMVWFITIPSEFSNIIWYMIKITPLNIPSEFDPWVKQPGTSPSSPHSNCRPLCAWDLPGWCSLRGSSMGKPHFFGFNVIYWLVVEPPLWKIWKSVGIIIPNIWKPPTSFIWSETSKDWDFESLEISWNLVSQNEDFTSKSGDFSAVPLDAARSDHRIPHGTQWDPMEPLVNSSVTKFTLC